MISRTDRLSLPAGVRLSGSFLRDPVRAEAIPLNDTGRIIVEHASGRTVDEVAAALSNRFAIPEESAARDVLVFCAELNRRHLLNIDTGAWRSSARQAISRACLSFVVGRVGPGPQKRRPLDSRSVRRALWSTTVGLGPRAAVMAVAVASGAALVSAAVGAFEPVVALALGIGLGVAFTAHEAAHTIMLRGAACCLALSGLRASVLHAPLSARHRALVAAAGPTSGIVLGLLGLLAAGSAGSEALAWGTIPLITQGVGLTVAAGDGRKTCGLR
jgi:hypothetical protein